MSSWASYIPRSAHRPREGEELSVTSPSTPASLSRTTTRTDSPPVSRPSTPSRRWSFLLTPNSFKSPPQDLNTQTSQAILSALERTNNTPQRPSFGRMSISSMMGGLSSLSLSRVSTRESTINSNGEERESRGRLVGRPKSASGARTTADSDRDLSLGHSRARSSSPFFFRRFRTRETSPVPQSIPLAQSDTELSDAAPIHPRSTAFTDDPDSGDEQGPGTDAESEDDDEFTDDPETLANTERNANIVPENCATQDVEEPDPLGEGVNVVVPHEPYFPTASTARGRKDKGPKRRKTLKPEPLPFQTSRPVFQRDRCAITIIQGDPDGKLAGRRRRRYMIASDLGEESRYALEWGIGTVLRDGDELLVVHVIENESKVDPPIPGTVDRTLKLRSQQERQGFSYILVRQSTSLLQRTRLHVRIVCQAWHAKNARHMLLDIADYYEPIMLVVGSRGLGRLSGILLGSTSHYLIQKCSVPVMIARRRLKRPPKKSAHLVKNRAHVSLAEAAIDTVAAKVDTDVKTMRDEVERDEQERKQERSTGIQPSMRDTQNIPEGGDEGDEGDDAEDEGDDVPQQTEVV